MVTTRRPPAARTVVTQENAGLPSRSTVHDPHWPSPQPYFVPVNPKSSRSTSSRGRSGSVSTLRAFPLTDNRMVAMCLRPPTIASTGGTPIERCRLLNYGSSEESVGHSRSGHKDGAGIGGWKSAAGPLPHRDGHARLRRKPADRNG